MAKQDPLYVVQTYGKGWVEIGKFFLWNEAVKHAKALSRGKYSDGSGFMPSRIRFKRRTKAMFVQGKAVSPKMRMLYVWPDGSREWQS